MSNERNMDRRVLTLVVGRDDGVVKTYFGIEHDGKLWLVTSWLIKHSTGIATPERMIRVDNLQPKPTKVDPSENEKFDYVNVLLPKSVIEGLTEESQGYEILSLPGEPKVHRSELYILPSVHG